MRWRALSWIAAALVAAAAFVYGAVDEGPPRTNADRVRALAEDFACPVCAGQSVAESDVPVAREIRRQVAVWVDEGRSDAFIRDQLVAAYDVDIDYNPSGSGITGLVWILPVLATGGIATVVVVMLRSGDGSARAEESLPVVGRRRRWRNAAVWTVAILVVAGGAGLLVARSSGSRSADGSVTGEIRVTSRELIFEAQRRLGEGDMDGAIAAYDEALEMQPSNAEALTYRGWLTSRRGDLNTAVEYLDDASPPIPLTRTPGCSVPSWLSSRGTDRARRWSSPHSTRWTRPLTPRNCWPSHKCASGWLRPATRLHFRRWTHSASSRSGPRSTRPL